MMKSIKCFGIMFLFLISLQSCKRDDIYHDLSDDAKGFIFFDVNDTFKLKNLSTNEVITFYVTTKNFAYEKDGSGESSFFSFGVAPADTFIQKGTYTFSDNSNCYKGEMSVIANQEGGFTLTARIHGCLDDLNSFYYYNNVSVPTIDIEGIQYQNAYMLNSDNDILYYSKEKGILKIVDDHDVTLFTYVE